MLLGTSAALPTAARQLSRCAVADIAPLPPKAPIGARRPLLSLTYLGANVPLVIAIFALPDLHLYLWGLMSLGSVAAIAIGVIRFRPHHRLAWVFAGLGMTTFAFGDISYDVLTKFFHESN